MPKPPPFLAHGKALQLGMLTHKPDPSGRYGLLTRFAKNVHRGVLVLVLFQGVAHVLLAHEDDSPDDEGFEEVVHGLGDSKRGAFVFHLDAPGPVIPCVDK